MDDYNVSMLSEAKNEYSIRLLNILAPLTIEGIKSILKEAWDLCVANDEEKKYLMTFQNFLSRVPKWNQSIIDEETKRIIEQSGCNYIEDLITCVHITQLKILTSIRVGTKKKKIDLDIPKLPDFVHRVYILFARKIYSNVYLFDKNLSPIQYQKSMRECDQICRDCILDAIRASMPVETILRSYIDSTVEEDIIEEIVTDVSANIVEETKKEEVKDASIKDVTVKKNNETIKVDTKEENEKKQEEKKVELKVEEPVEEEPVEEEPVKEEPVEAKEETINVETTKATDTILADNKVELETAKIDPIKKSLSPKTKGLSFSDTDIEYNAETKEKKTVSAPKTIERLEKIATERNNERKAEEQDDDDDDRLTIFRDQPDIKLGNLDIQVLDNTKVLKKDPILTDIEILA